MILSRWQANGGSYSTTISYAAHTGERSHQYRLQPKETVRAYAILKQSEGKTERSEAFRELSRMLSEIEAI